METAFLGIGRIPWILMKSDAKSLRGSRGESPITTQAMETADRLNAVEQVSYLISRYNSHANVAVIGDGASLKLESDGRVEKDVADVLTFPGGTALQVLTLPTDPQMIEHQRKVLTDALFGCFGLTRVDTDTVGTLGSISGYALEILNQKQESTTGRITRTWRKCWNDLIDLVLDCHAWWALGQVQMLDNHGEWQDLTDDEMMAVLGSVDDPDAPIVAVTWWNVDPAATFPNRTLKISMGTGYIVDDVMIRDDFTAGLISRKEALRQRGMGPTQIDQIEQEIGEEKPPTPEIGAFGQGGTTGGARLQPVGTKAGSTLGTAKAAR